MRISFPAPALVQGSDEEVLVEMADIIFPGAVDRGNGNGLRVWVEGNPGDPESTILAAGIFQTLLGALRAWRPSAGELREEMLGGVGQGSVRDEKGNQWMEVGPAVAHLRTGGEVEAFATRAAAAIATSEGLRNALWVFGRAGRTSADYYMIHEYAAMDLGGKNGVREALGISNSDQDRLTQSANNLSPLEGGRHARTMGVAPWSLEDQREFTADLVRRWIRLRAD